MVDLHLGAGTGVAGVHVLDYGGPGLRSSDGVTLGASAVPGVNSVGGGGEATGGDTGVGDGGLEDVGVGSGHDVLKGVSNHNMIRTP